MTDDTPDSTAQHAPGDDAAPGTDRDGDGTRDVAAESSRNEGPEGRTAADEDPPVSRRSALKAGGLLALLGFGAGRAAADPQGKIGTAGDPLRALYTESLRGGVTGGSDDAETPVSNLVGENLSVSEAGDLEATDTHVTVSNSIRTVEGVEDIEAGQGLDLYGEGPSVTLAADVETGGGADTHTDVSDDGSTVVEDTDDVNFGSGLSVTDDGDGSATVTFGGSGPAWEDSGGTAGLLEPTGSGITGIEQTDTVQSSSGSGLTFNTDAGTELLNLSVPKTPDGAAGNEDVGNVVAGHPDNQTKNGAAGVVIAGGGNSNETNVAASHYMTIGGGFGHTTGGVGAADAAEYATISGGRRNEASADGATVGGGEGNNATSGAATVAGGNDNEASGSNAFVGGGQQNIASGLNSTAPGGQFNRATADASHATGEFAAAESNDAFVFNDGTEHTSIPNSGADGLSSDTAVDGETVTGSQTFSASATNGFRFITGGATTPKVTYIDASGNLTAGGNVDLDGNKLTDSAGTLTVESSSGNSLTLNTDGGSRALELGIPGSDGFNTGGGNVVAGHPNNAVNNSAVGAVVGGGGSDGIDNENTVEDNYGVVGGGKRNQAGSADADEQNAQYATVGGGWRNTASSDNATVGGGQNNTASSDWATVGGGKANTASGVRSTVPGGSSNTADGNFSFAAGRDADTNGYDGAFVFGDSSSTTIKAGNKDEVRSQMPMYAPSFNSTSARAEKTAIEPITPDAILDGVRSMEVSTWEFEDTDDGRHVGPMAEDFHDAFEFVDDDGTIATVDADGVAFAAIQGLSKRLDAKDDRIEDLESETERLREEADDLRAANDQLRAENEQLRERNADLESRLDRIEAHLGLDEAESGQGVADD